MTAPSFDSSPGTPSVGVGLILSTAWGSFRRRFGLHAGFGALWFVGIFLLTCVTMCCLLMPIAFAVGASGAAGAAAMGPEMIGMLVVVYGAMFVVTIVAMALHQNVTCALTGADLNGWALPLREAVRRGLDRLLPQSLLSALRMLADMLVLSAFVGIPFGVLVAIGSDSTTAEASSFLGTFRSNATILGIAYLFGGVAVLAMRAFTGLGPTVVVAESLGPLDALSRSTALLSGHRFALVGAKFCVWFVFFVVYLFTVGMMFATMDVPFDPSNPPSQPVVSPFMAPALLVIYAFMLLVYAFDHVCEAALYSQLVRPVHGAEATAHVFR